MAVCWGNGYDTGSSAPASQPAPKTPKVVRLPENPVITPATLGSKSHANINGPSLIRMPAWVQKPLGKYYLYFADHGGVNCLIARP